MRKNTVITIIAVASAILLSASCEKLGQSEPEIEPKLKTEGKTFTATIEQGLTKTTIDGDLKVNWKNGDQININGSVYFAAPLNPATCATFEKIRGGEPESPYVAVYPASLYKTSGNYEFPTIQEYSEGEFNAPMYAVCESENLLFQNICGVLCLSLTGTDKVKRISVMANEALCGAFTVENGTGVCLTGTGKRVTLDCGQEGVQLGSTPTKFYIYLPPNTYSAGMKIVITNTDEFVFEKVTTGSAAISASNVYSFSWDVSFDPALTGEFSVGEGKKVSFSQGNLHATKVGDKWTFGFYEKQNEVNSVATANYARTATLDDKDVDLFTWGYDESFSANPTTEYFVTSSFSDWGSQIGSGNTWRTLSSEEWDYLLSTRANADKLHRAGVNVCGVENCLVIAPDNFSGDIAEHYNNEGWAAVEAIGFVCLPSAGYRYGVGVDGTGRNGFYWTSSALEITAANALGFIKEGTAEELPPEVVLDYFPGNGVAVNTWAFLEDYADVVPYEESLDSEIPFIKFSPESSQDGAGWRSQFQFTELQPCFEVGATYSLTVKARILNAESYDMHPYLVSPALDFSSCGEFPDIHLTQDWTEFEVETVCSAEGGQNISFDIGNNSGIEICVASVVLKKISNLKPKMEVRVLQVLPGDGIPWGPGVSAYVDKVDNVICYVINNTTYTENDYDAQYPIGFPAGTVEPGQNYLIKVTAKATDSFALYGNFLTSNGWSDCGYFCLPALSAEWQEVVTSLTCTNGEADNIVFNLGHIVGTIWMAQASVNKLVDAPYVTSTGITGNNRNYGLSVRLVRNLY